MEDSARSVKIVKWSDADRCDVGSSPGLSGNLVRVEQALLMDDIDNFLDRHRIRLLEYLDGVAPKSTDQPGPLEYVHEVLDEWRMLFSGRKIRKPNSRERTFWFALYQMEELVEFPAHDPLDPYEAVMMKDLATVRELLRERSALPERFYATRPGEIGAATRDPVLSPN